MADESVIRALQRERVGYVRRGLTDRVAQVDAELARQGVHTERAGRPAEVETAVVHAPETRGRGRRRT